jgi:hypothetical protein
LGTSPTLGLKPEKSSKGKGKAKQSSLSRAILEKLEVQKLKGEMKTEGG